jgi:catechol 2,3-dioxygenase-like lactoylglutathione lyase family enzyme
MPKESRMLADHPVDLILDVPDLDIARAFYVDRIGLRVVREDDRGAVDLQTGGGRIALRHNPDRGEEELTRASWRVDDLTAELAELRSRGVTFKDYDLPGLGTINNVADLGFAWATWFTDPAHNVIGVLQYK